MLDVNWLPNASREFQLLVQYVRDRDIAAAGRLEDVMLAAVKRLSAMPFIGRKGRVQDSREWVAHSNYIIVYRIGEEAITILRVLHARQRYP